MFKRLVFDSWLDMVPYLCFALIGGAFLLILFRAITMKPSETGRLAAMPLLDDEQLTSDTSSTTPPSVTNDEQ